MTYSPERWALIDALPSQGVSERHMAHVRARIAEFSPWAPEPHVEWIAEDGEVVFTWNDGARYASLSVRGDRTARVFHDAVGVFVGLWIARDETLPADFRAFVEAMHLPACLRDLAPRGVPAEIIAHARERLAEIPANAPEPRVEWDAAGRQVILTWRSSMDTVRIGVCESAVSVSYARSEKEADGYYGLTAAYHRDEPLPPQVIPVIMVARADVCEDEAWGVE